jgi:hypothetical protein
MTMSKANNAILRKFTNERFRYKGEGSNTHKQETDALKTAASALFDLKSVTKGRNLFRRKKYGEILQRRDSIVREDPSLGFAGAFQRALKELWQEADQDYWEREGSEANDNSVFEYVPSSFFMYHSILQSFQKSEDFP